MALPSREPSHFRPWCLRARAHNPRARRTDGTNFPLGKLMNEALPASASTSARMAIATLALGPFLFQLSPSLRLPALLCGCFTALGYVTQSAALVDTPAATVAFLGALTVVVCPALAAAVDGRRLGLREAPQARLLLSFSSPS